MNAPAGGEAPYDIIVVGGGIHGAGVAQAAAAAGYRCLLLDAGDWGAATSSRSSKLIHGGLRYLESGQIPLVYHSLRERHRLLRLAPELVRPVPFYIPIYRQTRRRPWQIRAGLSLYALLAGLHPLARFKSLPRRQWSQLGGLRQQGLQAVFRYWDAQTDDHALTRAVVASATALGADTRSHSRVLRGERDSGGYRVSWQAIDGEHQAHCRVLVNACGPWVNDLLACLQPPLGMRAIALVQGSHIQLRQRLGDGVFYLEAPQDGRAVFVMPWASGSLVGTTETEVANADAPTPTAAEIDYLREAISAYFPDADTTPAAAFAGVRVLPGEGGSAFRRPRDTVLLPDDPQQPRLLSIYGGKLTTYRHTAERALQLLRRSLGPRSARADTRQLHLAPVAANTGGQPAILNQGARDHD